LAAGGRALHKALVIVPILGWLGVGALLHQTRDWPTSKPDAGVVVVVPPRPAAAAPATQPPAALPRAADRTHLTRELHKELKRVGCYDGEISGVWSSASRQAMRRFTVAVNAKLPIEEPDIVLLRLAQGQGQRVCACPTGPGESKPSCATSPGPAEAGKTGAGEARIIEAASAQRSTPLIVGAAATTAVAATALARPEPGSSSARLATAPVASEEESRAARTARPSGPTPPADVYPTRRRHTARRADSRPPAVVQSLVRDMQRALGSFGIR
jgi:hypothetical protein